MQSVYARVRDGEFTNDSINEFAFALFEENGVLNNVKAQKCFDIAWEIGHTNGFEEVVLWFETLVGLIK